MEIHQRCAKPCPATDASGPCTCGCEDADKFRGPRRRRGPWLAKRGIVVVKTYKPRATAAERDER
jgi:hypothetical protein